MCVDQRGVYMCMCVCVKNGQGWAARSKPHCGREGGAEETSRDSPAALQLTHTARDSRPMPIG